VNNLPYQNPPFIVAHDANYINLALPGSTLNQGYNNFPSAACTLALLQAFSPTCLSGVQIHVTNPNLQPAVDQQWNLSIQRQLGKNTSVSIGYVGNKIDHMSDIFILNQKVLVSPGVVAPGPFVQSIVNCNPVAGGADLCPGGPGQPAPPQVRLNGSSGIQRYNALQVSVAERPWHGVAFQANYTWSKCMANSFGYFGQFGDEEQLPGAISQTNGASFFFQNSYNALGDYGRCISDVASLFNGYLTYDLPFGQGKMFGGSASGIAEAIIGGWSLASDFTFHTGFAINSEAPDQSGTGSFANRSNCVSGVSQSGSGALVNLGPGANGIQFLNPAAVALPTAGTFGNCGVGSFRGPGLTTADLSINKHFTLGERTGLQFMTQFINVTNTPILGAPNANFGSTFGVISTSNPGRQVQFGMKLLF
jgi:hypothetical protein